MTVRETSHGIMLNTRATDSAGGRNPWGTRTSRRGASVVTNVVWTRTWSTHAEGTKRAKWSRKLVPSPTGISAARGSTSWTFEWYCRWEVS